MALLEEADSSGAVATFSAGEGRNVINVTGELDASNKPVLEATIREARTSGCPVRLDMSGVTFMDSSALSVFVNLYKTDCVGDLRIINPSPFVRRLCEITGVAERFIL